MYMVECLDLLKIIILLYSNLYISLINTNQFILNSKAVLVVNFRSKLYIVVISIYIVVVHIFYTHLVTHILFIRK